MILNMPNINFSDDEWLYILKQYLNGWTEIPLSDSSGYDLDELKFYDGFIGFLIKQTEFCLKNYPHILDKKFINSWKYQGKLYRIIHMFCNKSGKTKSGYSCQLPKVQYHGMITHWTDDYTFEGLTYKLNKERKHIILEADTKDHIGFNVNKFRKVYNCENSNTEKEREIIFPMYKDCIIKEHHLTINEFIKLNKRKAPDK